MSSAFDVGGAPGFGSLEGIEDAEPFHHEWEARVFALNRLFLQRGAYTLDEFRDTIERMEPAAYRAASYYERWLDAIETLVERKGLLPS